MTYKYNYVKFFSTNDQEEELLTRLTSTGVVIDVEPYNPLRDSHAASAMPPEVDIEGVVVITALN